MGWKGMAIGGWLGSVFGGPLGAILGAALGHQIEGVAFRKGERRYSSLPHGDRSLIFCASAAAMLAKMAKADGVVTADEIASVESAFRRLGFSAAARRHAIDVFRRAKEDGHTIYDYAREFAKAVDALEVRELFYEILWDVACADGRVGGTENQILQRIPAALGIRREWYGYFASHRFRRESADPRTASRPALADAYALLGASESDDAETLKRKYRELAKRNHPDALRAQGLPEEMVGKATERMSRINAAWALVREARNI